MSSNERTAEAVASDEETPPIRLPEPVSACQVHLDTPAPDGTSGTFLASSGQRCIRAGQGDVGPELVDDLSPWAPLGEVEDLAELVLGLGGFGEHPSGLWAATGGGVDQDGLLDVGELGEQFADRVVLPGLVGFASHQVGDWWAICNASTQVKVCTRMLCSVQWRIGENETTCGSLSELGVGLGPVGRDHWPLAEVVAVGGQDPFAEDLSFQRVLGFGVDGDAQSVFGWGGAGELADQDAAQPWVVGDRGDLGGDLGRWPAGLAAGQRPRSPPRSPRSPTTHGCAASWSASSPAPPQP